MILIFTALYSTVLNASTQDEINHLLNFVRTTDCQYERNGTMHTGAEAHIHIKKKYNYFADDIKTTEDFIKYAATKSKMSGQYYKIHCPNKATIKSKVWLTNELMRFRAK